MTATLAVGQLGGSDDLTNEPDGGVPVDGGTSLLLAAGAALGGRKLYRSVMDTRRNG